MKFFGEQALFQDERRRKIQRTGAAHGEIVDRAVDCQSADVAAGKENRRNHERVGGESQARAVDLDDGLVIQLVQYRIGEGREKNLLDQFGGELATAAVPENDLLMLEDGQRTRTEERRRDLAGLVARGRVRFLDDDCSGTMKQEGRKGRRARW